jgi:ketosteroid isomerase-like protein
MTNGPSTVRTSQPSAGTGRTDNTAAGVEPQPWTNAFAAKTPEAFAAAFSEDVTLEATALTRPINGRDNVKVVMAGASAIYESLQFTQQTTDGDRTYLEWQATGMGGQAMFGVTVLTTAEDGRIRHVAIHHRPLGALLLFSATLGDALDGTIDRSAFHTR